MRQIVLSLSCCDLQAPLGQGRPCNLWTPPRVPVGAQGPTPAWAGQGPGPRSQSWAKVIAQILTVSLGGEGPGSERPVALLKSHSKARQMLSLLSHPCLS